MRKIYFLLACILILQQIAIAKSPDSGNFIFSVEASTFNVVFTNTSVLGNEPGDRKAFWKFGDGKSETTGALKGTQHHYSSAGSYTVCLRIFRYTGLHDSVITAEVCKTILIESGCGADFERLPLFSLNHPLRSEFRAHLFNSSNKRPSKICWTFGDGRDTCINYTENYTGPYTVGHTYNHPSQYEVCVRIIYYGGCEAKKCHMVSIVNPVSCSAGFIRQAGASLNNPLRTEFLALPAHSALKKPSKICWTFGDGRDTCINYTENYTGAYSVAHTYKHNGKYEVCVRINYYGGCEAKKCQTIEITRTDSCSAGFIRQPGASINNRLRIELKALPWHNNNKKPSKICWTFGDGQDACISYTETYSGFYTIAHTYTNAGEYEVCEKITYFGGCEKRVCKKIRVPDHHEPHLILTPNPVHDKVHALYFSPIAGTVNISILSTNAQVRSYSRTAVAGINNWDFDLGILPPGIYTLVVQSANQTVKVMFAKI